MNLNQEDAKETGVKDNKNDRKFVKPERKTKEGKVI